VEYYVPLPRLLTATFKKTTTFSNTEFPKNCQRQSAPTADKQFLLENFWEHCLNLKNPLAE